MFRIRIRSFVQKILVPDLDPDPNPGQKFWIQKIASTTGGMTRSVADPDPGSGAFFTPGSGIRDG